MGGRRPDSCEFPKIGKNPVRKSERRRELQFFLERITDGTDTMVGRPIDPPFQPGPKRRRQDGIIAPVEDPAWIFSKPIERSEMGDLRKSGEISVKVRIRLSHLFELIEIIMIPRQRWGSTMSRDDVDSALKGQTKSFDALKISAVGGQRKLAPGVGQKRKTQTSHALPERLVNLPVTIDGLHAGQKLEKNGTGFSATLQLGDGVLPRRVN